jgi:hypothetical protein
VSSEIFVIKSPLFIIYCLDFFRGANIDGFGIEENYFILLSSETLIA